VLCCLRFDLSFIVDFPCIQIWRFVYGLICSFEFDYRSLALFSFLLLIDLLVASQTVYSLREGFSPEDRKDESFHGAIFQRQTASSTCLRKTEF
jgi:hypothetical protein